MRVLQFICPTGYYGAERWITALARNLDNAVVTCDLLVTSEDRFKAIELMDHFPVDSGQLFRIEMEGRFDLKIIKQAVKIVKQRNIDVIHTHGYKSDILGLLIARKAGIKCLSTPHGFGQLSDLKLRIFVRIGCWFLRFFDRVAPLSEELLMQFEDLGILDSRLEYIPNGLDLMEIDEFQHVQDAGFPKSIGGTIGYVGRLTQGKGIDQLLLAFDLVWQSNPHAQLVLVGDGELKEELESLAKSLSCSENVSFTGFRTDRFNILQTFDLFAMASVAEGIPRSVMEAMAMRLPVVAYDIPGVAQLVLHEETGLLAPLGNTKRLADYFSTVLNSAEKQLEFGISGRKRVEGMFSGARMAAAYTELYKRLLASDAVSR